MFELKTLAEADDKLLAAPLSNNDSTPSREKLRVDPEFARNAREQREAFGKNVASGKLAGFGDDASRAEQDIADAYYEYERVMKSNADAMKAVRQRLKDRRFDALGFFLDLWLRYQESSK